MCLFRLGQLVVVGVHLLVLVVECVRDVLLELFVISKSVVSRHSLFELFLHPPFLFFPLKIHFDLLDPLLARLGDLFSQVTV